MDGNKNIPQKNNKNHSNSKWEESRFPPRIRGGGTVLPAFLSINLSLLFAICSIIMVDK